MRLDAEREVTQDLGSQAIAQAYILKSDHPPLSDNSLWPAESRGWPRLSEYPGMPFMARGLGIRNCAFTGLSCCRHSGAGAKALWQSACHGFRSINGRLLGLGHKKPLLPCRSPVRVAPRRTRSTRPHLARPGAP